MRRIDIRYKKGQDWCRTDSLLEITGAAYMDAPVISVVGAGGKTTTIWRMAEEFVKRNKPVIVTTTTHMKKEAFPWFLCEPSVGEMERLLEAYKKVCVGAPAENGKIQAVSKEFLGEILKRGQPVLIEADGAKHMPVKIPAEHEPVILPQSTHVFAVYGMDAVGSTIEEACFRKEKAEILLRKSGKEKITAQDIAMLASSEYGGRKNCPPDTGYWVILNKAESASRLAAAEEICWILQREGIKNVLVTGEGVQSRT
ncbi:putative selenium-dependent hydroxylase accessory protein YqeC [Ruminococcus sp. AF18-22]|nr:putative selenium-dependent hydroxylase accessory protein YqeC [Ruminococcus sp. AF18-22]